MALKQDVFELSTNINSLETQILEGRELILHIENKLPYEKKLDRLFIKVYYHRSYKTINNSGFELLKERGFDIIINPELRKRITKHYTTDLSALNGILSRLEQVNLIQGDNIYDNFRISNTGYAYGIMTAYDYEKLLNDPKILGPFYHFELLTFSYKRYLSDFKENTEEVLKLVEVELNKRNN